MKFKNTVETTVIRKGEIVHTEKKENLVTTEGANKILDVMFDGDTQIGASGWFLGLITGSTPTVVIADTMSSNGWTEFEGYSESVRENYTTDNPSNGAIVNGTTVAEFSINANGTIGGVFICTSNTKGGFTGILFGEVSFPSGYSVINGDVYRVSYTIQLIPS